MVVGRRLTKLPGAIESKAGVAVVSAGRANVEDILALVGGAILSEEFESLGAALITADRCGMNQGVPSRRSLPVPRIKPRFVRVLRRVGYPRPLQINHSQHC